MANENEEITQQNNNETESNEQQTIGDKLRKTSLSGNVPNNQQTPAATNGDATDTTSKQTKYTSGSTAGGLGDYKNIRATTTSAIHSETHTQQPVRREENPFSFKHFLNREPSSSGSGASSFVINSTSLPSSDSAVNNNDTGSSSSSSTTTAAAAVTTSSTGVRPKVPQSSSSSLIGNCAAGSSTSGNGNVTAGLPSESSKMKRSPRFSSFDSQASLAEYAATGSGVLGASVSGSSSSAGISHSRASPNFRISQNIEDEPSPSVPREEFVADPDRQQFVPRRSYSNYDIEVQPSPRRRAPETATRSSRVFAMPQPSQSHHNAPSSSNQRPPNQEFAAAAALPDFVQDHWMEAWYCNEMNLNSPPNSPNSPIDFVEDITGGAASTSNNAGQAADTKCQTLPDFLSDGPIIHSSQRLADVAAGLPAAANWSNMDSPEDDSPSMQLSRLRLENERLCIELNETRQALSEQTSRANELERSLEQARSIEAANSRSRAQNLSQVEEDLEQSKKRTLAAQNQVAKLNLQVKQLTAELKTLRRENESLRDGDGAIGGSCSTEQRPDTAGASCSSSSYRPSRSHQISNELQRAAATAENNLRQLLAGVENLRQLAADIENSDSRFDYNETSSYPPMSDDFLEDCDDDYDEYTGGPSL